MNLVRLSSILEARPIARIVSTLTFVCLFVAPRVGVAGLIGDTAQFERKLANYFTFDSKTSLIGAGNEFQTTNIVVDVTDNAVNFTWVGGVKYSTGSLPQDPHLSHDLRVFDLDWVGEPSVVISGINVDFGGIIEDSFSPFDPPGTLYRDPFNTGNVSFADHAVAIDVSGYFFGSGSFVSIELQNSGAPSASSAPEPSSFVLVATGMLCLFGYSHWRKKRSVMVSA